LVKERPYSEEIAREIDKEVRAVVDSCYKRAKAIVSDHRDQLDAIANGLLEREVLEKDQVYELLGLTPPEETSETKEGDKAGRDSRQTGTQGEDPAIGGLDSPAPQPA
jgi:cell division protease FtsH